MDEKQKAIEKMEKVIERELGIFFGGGDTVEPEDFPYQAEGIAEALVNAGYGDLRAFAEALKKQYPPRTDKRCTLDDCYMLDKIDETLNEFLGGENNND